MQSAQRIHNNFIDKIYALMIARELTDKSMAPTHNFGRTVYKYFQLGRSKPKIDFG